VHRRFRETGSCSHNTIN